MITFLKAAFKNISQTGSVVESSPFLSAKMIDNIDFNKELHIVELGAGTGSITKSLLKNMNQQSTLTSFEINTDLYTKLQKNGDKRLTEINADASNLCDHFKGKSIDYIVSGLPLANIPAKKKTTILNACYEVLKPGGFYIQYQYSRNDFRLLQRLFGKVDSWPWFVSPRTTLLNRLAKALTRWIQNPHFFPRLLFPPIWPLPCLL